MKKYFLSLPLLFLAFKALAHVGEEVEEHADEVGEAVQASTNIGPAVFIGVLGAGIVGFILWLILKK